jgi:hypothetical protein
LKDSFPSPIIIRRDGLELYLAPFGAIALDLFRKDAFLSIDWEERKIWVDFGDGPS